MDRLRGRGIIVTGAGGIAAASARRFAREGARVAIVSRTAGSCQALAREIEAAGGQAEPVVADLTDVRAAQGAVLAAVAWLERVDGLFNVAGGSGRRLGDGPLHELTPEAYEATMRLNATTHVTVTAPVLRAMLAQSADAEGQRGAIVNMGSVLATEPVPELFATHAYAAAKGAIAALTTTAAAYYAPQGIRVNLVAPALTISRMSERAQADAATQDFARRKQPLTAGFIAAEDVAAAAAYLLSPEARAVTGQTITVDGGWSVLPIGE
ncbi:MAG: SDR family oxidoreductase [Chloroflexota bacterium]|jgi:NAD(P)-dependent dehydrogenase (short-subunit alcohol dehydrogenase family)